MALYLIGKSILDELEKIVVDGIEVQEHYGLISRLLAEKTPHLVLAEPVFTPPSAQKNGTISWYIDSDTEPFPPKTPEQQQWVQHQLSDAVTSLFHQFAEGTSENKILQAVFSLQSIDDILLADDKIILKEWGLKDKHESNKQKRLFLPAFLGVGASVASATTSHGTIHSVEKIEPVQKSVKDLPNPPLNNNISSNKTWATIFSPVILTRLLAAILFFVIGLMFGFRLIYAEKPQKIAGMSVGEAQQLVQSKPQIEQQNKSLEDEIKELEAKLKKPVCDVRESRADPSINKEIPNSQAPMRSDGGNFQGSLPSLLERSTVFVLSLKKGQDNEKVGIGTGFFVTQDLIVTNRHVVEDAADDVVLVTSKTLKQIQPAKIMAISEKSQIGSLDLAVLKIEGMPPQQPLSFTTEAAPLQDVVAAGYPGIMVQQDDGMKKLLEGDFHAIPGVILTKGEINAIQTDSQGRKIIPHSASVSPGNSGGPLTDMCGRVVGINTFVTFDKTTSSHGNYAQKSDDIIAALQNANIPIQVQNGKCSKTIQNNLDTNDQTPPSLDAKPDTKSDNPDPAQPEKKP